MEHFSLHLQHAGCSQDELIAAGKSIAGSVVFPKGFCEAPGDVEMMGNIVERAREYRSPALEGVILVGIGGSLLGATAVASALPTDREFFTAETTDPLTLEHIRIRIKAAVEVHKHYLLIVVSKSGSTPETIANMSVLLGLLQANDPQWQEHIVVITHEGSALWNYANERRYTVLASARDIGGRFSAFTISTLFPLAVAGIDVAALARGAASIQPACLNQKNVMENPALLHASAAFLNAEKGKTIHTLFLFAPALRALGTWWSQLVGESLGKRGKGTTPIVSIGSGDLHTVAQRYFDGPKDVFTTFISLKKFPIDFVVPSDQGTDNLVADIEGKKLGDILYTIGEGAKASYAQHNLPYAEHMLETLSAENIGAIMQMLMIEVIYTAQLMGVNAFDQPAVELYKKETKRLLHGS